MRRSWILSLRSAIKRLGRFDRSGREIQSPRIGACPDPAAVVGTGDEHKRAFRDAYHQLDARIRLFIALRIDKLDRMALKRRIDDIGRKTMTYET